jgi:hypothetical protein
MVTSLELEKVKLANERRILTVDDIGVDRSKVLGGLTGRIWSKKQRG